MDLILCHTIADFDILGAAVGLSRLHPQGSIVLTGSVQRGVKEFLAHYRHQFNLIEIGSVRPEKIGSLFIVDNQHRQGLGEAKQWLDLPHINTIEIPDHVLESKTHIKTTHEQIEAVGTTTTLIVEQLQQQGITLAQVEATVMSLGIHTATGSLTYSQTTSRDAYALAWLMSQGANVDEIARYSKPHGFFATARDLMSSPVRTIRPKTTIEQALKILLRYGHSGLSVVDGDDRLVGMVGRRDLDLALHHGLGHAPVKGHMTRDPKTITVETPSDEIQRLMNTYDLGRLPVLQSGQLVGIVTRKDILRHLGRQSHPSPTTEPLLSGLLPSLGQRLAPPLWEFLEVAALAAKAKGWHLYLVGGAVRDLLLSAGSETVGLQDLDLVVDGFSRPADAGAGVQLATELIKIYPEARLEIHGEFQTAALLWHHHPTLANLWVDIATARTEFYPYPAANPQVWASSITQDLYRRDFTINALALRLTPPRYGELLDFFGGVLDLRNRSIRVLHANSFIEDPTRIYRAVRFSVRLGFALDPLTVDYIHNAVNSGIYETLRLSDRPTPALTTRLRSELKFILSARYWLAAVDLLNNLGAWRCLHEDLNLNEASRWQLRYLSRWLFCLASPCPPWLLRLELLITAASPENWTIIAQNLHLPQDSIARLSGLLQAQTTLERDLPLTSSISEKVVIFKNYKIPTLILLGSKTSRLSRRWIWSYLTRWSKVKAPLNGEDLKALGYQPGPLYKTILAGLWGATLDGLVSDRASALDWLANNNF
ncbi:MAG: Poly(A) polymerase I [Chroococcopsis gigantea SAG 12.99]|nr:CBS domain-containing protein [Chlorogloea purpurea SAG 13.99]MDV3000461.1 Poly(A) polymerase I [Chroococcopsis gigantea SAG 12.99]